MTGSENTQTGSQATSHARACVAREIREDGAGKGFDKVDRKFRDSNVVRASEHLKNKTELRLLLPPFFPKGPNQPIKPE
jgi:hypothetical protein